MKRSLTLFGELIFPVLAWIATGDVFITVLTVVAMICVDTYINDL